MEIDKTFHENIVSLLEKYNTHDDFELEARYTANATKDQFDRCISYYSDNEDYQETLDTEKLDIIANDNRITLQGNVNIANYCKSNILPDIIPENIIVIKKTVESKPITFDDVDFKINLKREAVNENPEDVIDRLYLLDKSYRYKKRYSYINKDDGIRIDLTVVKSAMGNYKNFIESRVVSAPETYEIEIEIIKKKVKADIFLNHILNLYGIIHDEDHVCSKNEKSSIIKEYLKLCYKELPTNWERIPKNYFAGPQPITLEKKHIIASGLGVTTIRDDYTVTEKADGERYLLYVSTKGRCYFINSRLSVKFTGIVLQNLKNTLLDGEYVTKDLIGDPIKYYGIFDIYYYEGKDVRHLPLVGNKDSRLSAIDDCLKSIGKLANGNDDLIIQKKKFLAATGIKIFEHANEILKNAKSYPYHIDGLIFTPMYLPVGGMTMEDKLDKPVNTWRMVFKWKPAEENTIDFLVKFRKGPSNNPVLTFINSAPHRILDLRVGYDPSSWDKITARAYLEGGLVKKKSYIEKEFHPDDIIDDDITTCVLPMKSICENNDTIEDDSIVEFKYDNADDLPPFGLKWIPIRVRKDKTELYRKTKSIGGAANDIGSAMNIWRSIRVPVTNDMIRGKVLVDTVPYDNDVYYDRKIKRDKFASTAMMRFHNDVKRLLIMEYKGESVMDLACGKGGDLRKFIDTGFKKIFGLDSNRDNIENPVDGIYSRLIDSRIKTGKHVFLTYDLTKRIDINQFDTEDDKYVANIIYGHKKDMKLQKYERFASEKFDVISCQFAIHYFFENERTLDNFIDTVDKNLKSGGHFIGTCLNGHLIKKALVGAGASNEIQGKLNDRVLWNIKKLYTKNTGVVYGEEIEVFMESIGRVFKEYLVNIDLLEKKLKVLGYKLVKNQSFEELYGILQPENVDDIQKQYSFLNMTFAFQKMTSTGEPVKRVIKKKVPADA